MKIIKEHIKILECFFYDTYSFKDVSKILNIPEYKIRRHLNELFSYYNVKNLIELKKKFKVNWRIQLKASLDINQFDRRNYILLNFLNNDFINLNNVSLILNVSRRTLSKDLEEIKKILKTYNLTYSSLNSKGIQLIGDELNKKIMFNTLLFSLFLERNYLPNIFNFLFTDFNIVIDEQLQNIIKNKLLKKGVINHTYIMLNIEVILYIGIVRNNYNLNFYNLKFEVKTISNLCKKNKKQLVLYTYLNEFNEIKKFIQFINMYIPLPKTLPEEVYISLVTRFKLIETKNKLNLKEFYLLNKNFIETSEKQYDYFTKIVEKYFKANFKEIDSLDKISIFLILKNFLYFKDKLLEENIIVYNMLQILILNNTIRELKEKNIEISKAISIYSLKSYLKTNNIKNILIFENINLQNFAKISKDIKITQLSLPIAENDYLKIKENFINH